MEKTQQVAIAVIAHKTRPASKIYAFKKHPILVSETAVDLPANVFAMKLALKPATAVKTFVRYVTRKAVCRAATARKVKSVFKHSAVVHNARIKSALKRMAVAVHVAAAKVSFAAATANVWRPVPTLVKGFAVVKPNCATATRPASSMVIAVTTSVALVHSWLDANVETENVTILKIAKPAPLIVAAEKTKSATKQLAAPLPVKTRSVVLTDVVERADSAKAVKCAWTQNVIKQNRAMIVHGGNFV